MRQLVTQKWFEYKSYLYRLYIFVTAIDEIDELNNLEKRQNIKDIRLDYHMNILELSEDAIILLKEYMNNGAIPIFEPEDEYNIATASVN